MNCIPKIRAIWEKQHEWVQMPQMSERCFAWRLMKGGPGLGHWMFSVWIHHWHFFLNKHVLSCVLNSFSSRRISVKNFMFCLIYIHAYRFSSLLVYCDFSWWITATCGPVDVRVFRRTSFKQKRAAGDKEPQLMVMLFAKHSDCHLLLPLFMNISAGALDFYAFAPLAAVARGDRS